MSCQLVFGAEMYYSDQTITDAISHCQSCGSGLCIESKFCRYCGAAQEQPATSIQEHLVPIGNPGIDPLARYVTTRITTPRRYHPVSGPLVKAVIAGVPITTPQPRRSSLAKRMLPALMAIPIWVMIILLSPLDAYASAKIIGNRI